MNKVKIEISQEIYEKIKKQIEKSDEFTSVEDYITFVLEEILKEENEKEEEVYSKEDEEKVKERLHRLGYL